MTHRRVVDRSSARTSAPAAALPVATACGARTRENTVMILAPVELPMPGCSLIPAPGHPAQKYFGILAAGSRKRARVVPRPTQRRGRRAHAHGDAAPKPVASPVKWAELLKRVWGMDALRCPKCEARMTVMAVVENREEAVRFLRHAGELTVHVRARAPPASDAA